MIDSLVQFLMSSILIMAVVFPASWLFLTILTPKAVISKYIAPPYFTEFESIAYNYFPSTLTRTNLICLAVAFPIARKIRSFGDINKNVPLWFNLACRVYVYVVLSYSLFCVISVVALAVLIKFNLL